MKQKVMAFFLFLCFLFQIFFVDIPDDLVRNTKRQEDTKIQELEEGLEKQPVLVKETSEKFYRNERARRTFGKLRISFGEVPGKLQIYSGKTIARCQETKPKKRTIALQVQNRRAPPFAECKNEEEQIHTV
ncbi:MAG: hypothetical protein KIC52_05750 [Firmicutes bacterium]|nr:hypothetical protein [Bacillota bacterium]